MAKKPLPTPDELRQLLEYDPGSGVLTWRPRSASMFAPGNRGADKVCIGWNKKYAGQEAGNVHPISGYRIVGLGQLVGAHRVAWAIYYSEWPKHVIDHINGDPLDNSIGNLRDVTPQQNQKNCFRRVDNKSGVTGVSRAPRNRGWVAKIRVDGRQVHLGTFDTIEEAASARAMANHRFGFSTRHGS